MIQHALSRSSRAAATLCSPLPTPPTPLPPPPPSPFSLAAPLIPPQVPHPPRVYSQSTTSRNITRFTVYTSGNAPRVHSGRDVARITELLGNISRMPPALTYRADCNVGSRGRNRPRAILGVCCRELSGYRHSLPRDRREVLFSSLCLIAARH